MAQNMKLLLTDQSGENMMVELCSNETFEEFQQKVFREQNLCITVEDFQMFFENLTPADNLFSCLREALNLENDTNYDDMIYEIHLGRNLNLNIKDEHTNFTINDVENTIEKFDSSMMVLNEQVNQFTPLNENIFDTSDIQNNKLEDVNNGQILNEINTVETINKNDILENTEINNICPVIENKSIDTDDNSMKPLEPTESYSYMDIESKLAEMHDYNEEVITDLCRLCAKNVTGENKIEIYNENNHTDKLEEKINDSLPIKIKKEDGLPQQICGSCTDRLKNCYDFFQIVLEADKQLRIKFPNAQDDSLKNTSNEEYMTEFLNSPPANKEIQSKNIKFELEDKVDNSETEFETEYLEMDNLENKSETDKKNCRICDLIIENLDEAVSHAINVHHIENLYACIFCELGFEKSFSLDQHIRTEHKNIFLRKFKCNVCSKKYGTQLLLLKHTCVKAAASKTLHCEVCNQSFPTKVRLNFHRQFHLKDARPLHCTVCNITFKTETEFFDHVNFMHETQQTYPCDMCNKVFSIRSLLNNHKKNHTGVRKHKCETCSKTFLDKQTLKEHEMIHSETKLYQCHICGKHLNRLSRLKRHLLTHESDPVVNDVHVCHICKEAFADQITAESHKYIRHDKKDCIKIISTDKVFRCEFCEKCYYTPLGLNEHRSIHNCSTPYTCHICKAQFSTYPRCTTHKTTHGLYKDGAEKDNFPVVKNFLCEHCGKSYLHWTYLGLHRRLKHSDPAPIYMCADCNQQFPNSWGLAYHRKTKHPKETFKCNICNKFLANEHCLKLHHQTKHSQKDNQCVVCGKIFQFQTSLDAHIRTHKGLKEFKCALCPTAFTDLQTLTIHFKKHKARKFVFPEDKSEPQFTYLVDQEDRPFACDICGLSFRRQFTLKNHRLKHVKPSDTGSFVLMVDMKEDDGQEEDKNVAQPALAPQIVENKPQEIKYVQIPVGQDQTQNYIDLGNGNYVPIQGNTINVDGEQYVLVDENGKSIGRNQEFEMIVDETLRGEEQQPTVLPEQFDNSTVMYVDDSSYVLNENTEQPNYIVSDKSVTGGTTYVIGGNEFFIQPDEQTF